MRAIPTAPPDSSPTGSTRVSERGRCPVRAAKPASNKSLRADRLDITGARWSLEGAEAVLKLRALLANGDLDAYWAFHIAKEHQRNHQVRYQRQWQLAA